MTHVDAPVRDAWVSDELAPPDGPAWDLLVLGGGTAGIVAARTAAGFGATALLVEQSRTGGDCLWTGCVPSKALLAAAHAAAEARAASRYGIRTEVGVDFAAVRAHVFGSVSSIEHNDAPATLRHAGVRVAHAAAVFASSDTVVLRDAAGLVGSTDEALDGTTVRFRHAVIASGSGPAVPPVSGLAEVGPVTSDDIWDLEELPARLLVLGGGSIGCELGQAFARLGSQVTIVEAAAQLLPREDPQAAAVLCEVLQADGVCVRTGAPVMAFESTAGESCARLDTGETIGFDQVLVAVGRTPRTRTLGLDRAGIETSERGHVRVDARLRTTNPRVWAAGDVTGHPQFTHLAGVHGSLAASNAVLGLRRKVDISTLPRVTFTQPEVAAFGVPTGHDGDAAGLKVRTLDHHDVDRAIAEDSMEGFTRIVLDRKRRVVGATIVGPRAGESLPELVLAARHGLKARHLAAAVHAYPTYADGVWNSSIEQVRADLERPRVARLIRILVGWRRRRSGR